MSDKNYQPVIGLEIHIELATQSKMFCSCPADHFGKTPNTQTCPVCLGLPGSLPVPNKKAIDWTTRLGLALNCRVNEKSKFDRKHYFYPDLPKGYQISQYDMPLCENGYLEIGNTKYKIQDTEYKKVHIRRVHLEEDTGKLIHAKVNGEAVTLIDFNRSGVPLVEVVTEPDFENIEQVDEFLKKLQQIVRYLEISAADMEKGSLRIEPNVSIREFSITNFQLPNYKVEIKNINSFRFARRAIEYEIKRQVAALEAGEKLIQETRGWDQTQNQTVSQRTKEEAHDYRYFPEPDIPPMVFDQTRISKLKAQICELPDEKSARFIKQYGLSPYQAELLTETKEMADFFEQCLTLKVKQSLTPETVANWLINKKPDIRQTVPAELVRQIVVSKEVTAVNEQELEKIIEEVLAENPKAIEDYKKGKTAALGFLIGQAVKKLGPQTDRAAITQKLQESINSRS